MNQALSREYLRAHHDPGSHDVVELFAERAADYRAVVERVWGDALAEAVARILSDRASAMTQQGAHGAAADGGSWRFAVPVDLPAEWVDRRPACGPGA